MSSVNSPEGFVAKTKRNPCTRESESQKCNKMNLGGIFHSLLGCYFTDKENALRSLFLLLKHV